MDQRGERRGARAAVGAGDQHDIGVRLGDTRGNGSHTHFGHQLHADARVAVGILQIVDEFGEVLDGIDVVMRRRRDEADAGCGAARFCDPRVHLGAGQLPAFARLGALRHLDLQLLGVDQVVGSDAETSRRHLLDGRVLRIAVVHRDEAFGIFAALTGVALAADAVHGDRQRLVRFLGNGAVTHGARLEALHEAFDRLHFIDGDGLALLEIEQPTQRRQVLRAVVDELGVTLVRGVRPGAHRLLQPVDAFRIEQMELAIRAPLVLAARG
jgi:hypothetical protein